MTLTPTFHSAALDREMPYGIYLPQDYASSTRRYPVLYLLHGLFGSYENWFTLMNLASHVAALDCIIVTPDADDSWYTNSATVPENKFEDYITKNIVTEIDALYRTIPERQARAIAGLSMGGYAALKFVLRNPQSFAFAGCLSGAMSAARDLDRLTPDFAPKLLEVFGPVGNPVRAYNDIFQLIKNARPAGLPYLYLACGVEDGFLPVNREFVDELSQRLISYEYHETPGQHDWTYWDQAIRPMLAAMEKRLSTDAR
jgi:putative tributyrin esterase